MATPAPASPAPPRATPLRTASYAAATLACFAANSLLCRAALGSGRMDPATFTAVRIGSGALALAALLAVARGRRPAGGSWISALVMFAYAVTFSLAYVRIAAGVGALVLFVHVQGTMVGYGVATGARLGTRGWIGAALAIAGLAALTLPGAGAPDILGSVLMGCAGIAWGVYSIRGRRASDPLPVTADNFVRAAPLALGFLLVLAGRAHASPAGLALAAASGAVASGMGYAIWYAVLPALGAARAGTLQLAVPVLAAVGAWAFLGERLPARTVGAGLAILLGVGLSVAPRRPSAPAGARASSAGGHSPR